MESTTRVEGSARPTSVREGDLASPAPPGQNPRFDVPESALALTVTFHLEPGHTDDPAWAEHVRALPPEDRERLLLEADEMREGGDLHRRTACDCYRAFFESLDMTRDSDAQRVSWFARNASEDEAEATRALPLPESSDGPGRAQAGLRLSRLERNRGRSGEVVDLLYRLVPIADESGDLLARAILLELTMVLVTEQRGLEAVVTASRAVARSAVAGDDVRLNMARLGLSAAYAMLQDWERFDETLAAVEGAVIGLSGEARRTVEEGVRIVRIDAAFSRGDSEDALARLASIEESHPQLRAWILSSRAVLHAARGEYELSREAREAARRSPELMPWMEYWLETADLQCAMGADPEADWVGRLEEYVVGLEEGRFACSLFERTENLARLADVLRDRGRLDLARRLSGVAGASVLERIREMEQTVRTRPDLLRFDEEGRRVLRDLRKRLHREHRGLGEIVAGFFGEHRDRADRLVGALVDDDGILVVCAWCGCVRSGAREWIPVGQYLPDEGPLVVSHGMCPDCLQDTTLAS